MNEEEIQSMFKLYRDDAKQKYLECKSVFDHFKDKPQVPVKMSRYNCIMDAGIYNKNKKMYQKGYALVIKQMYKTMEDYNPDTYVNIDPHGEKLFRGKEDGYLKLCNHYKEEKEILDTRHRHLMMYGYFN